MANYLTVDVGGTNIKYAIMDENAVIAEKGEVPTPYEGLEGFIDTLKSIYDKFADRDLKALAMSAPGRIDANTGYFYTSGALKYITGVNLTEKLKDVIPLPFGVENDAKAAALAELWKGSMVGIDNGLILVLGTGIGGALVINGKLYRGSTFAAGELSCFPTIMEGIPFRKDSIWTKKASTSALVNQYAENLGKDPAELNGRILFEAANNGDEIAVKTVEKFAEYVASGIMGLQFCIDVRRVAIGGGISKQPVLMELVDSKLSEMFTSYQGNLPISKPEVMACEFGNDANMIGALYHYLYELN
ncbi:MAG: ROK family protein [Erysipelotrichaceae bacterium]|nr:ROK family protein [Erysipelotrichaceae bacterium]